MSIFTRSLSLVTRCLFGAFLLFGAIFIAQINNAQALSEVESATTFRGEKKSLSLPVLKVYFAFAPSLAPKAIEKELIPLLKGIAQVSPEEKNAHLSLNVTQDGKHTNVSLKSLGAPSLSKNFTLPAQAEELKQALLGYAHGFGLQNLQKTSDFSAVSWNIQKWIPANAGEQGAQNISGEFWKPENAISVEKEQATQSYSGRTLLSFSFTNSSPEDVYVYMFNSTDAGQIIPILAPKEQRTEQNTLGHGRKLTVEGIYLELGAKEENIHLIITREPLSFEHWQQESFWQAKQNFIHSSHSPAKENWTSRRVIFLQK